MEKRSESYWIRLTPEELADWRRRAAALSISVAELVRLKMRLLDGQKDHPLPVRYVPLVGRSPEDAQEADRPSRVSGGLARTEVTPRFKASAKVKG